MRVRSFPFSEDVERFLQRTAAVPSWSRTVDAQFRGAADARDRVEKSGCDRCCTTTGCRSPRRSSRGVLADCNRASQQQPKAPAWEADMTFIANQGRAHRRCRKNALGFTAAIRRRAVDVVRGPAGMHSITARSSRRAGDWRLEPQNMVKLSGIGCSSKTTAYFVSGAATASIRCTAACPRSPWRERRQPRASVHWRFGRRRYPVHRSRAVLPHAIRRNLNMPVHHREHGVYWAHQGAVFRIRGASAARPRRRTKLPAADRPVLLAMTPGASFVARSFSGDKQQLVPLMPGGAQHQVRPHRRALALR